MVSSWRSGKYSLALTFVCLRALRQPFSPDRALPLLVLFRLHHRKRRFSVLYRAGTDEYTYNRTVLWACSHVKPQPNDLRRLMVVLAVDPRSPRLRDKLLLMKPSRASLSSAFVISVRCCSRFWRFSCERRCLILLINPKTKLCWWRTCEYTYASKIISQVIDSRNQICDRKAYMNTGVETRDVI